jgi:hypothetical protein
MKIRNGYVFKVMNTIVGVFKMLVWSFIPWSPCVWRGYLRLMRRIEIGLSYAYFYVMSTSLCQIIFGIIIIALLISYLWYPILNQNYRCVKECCWAAGIRVSFMLFLFKSRCPRCIHLCGCVFVSVGVSAPVFVGVWGWVSRNGLEMCGITVGLLVYYGLERKVGSSVLQFFASHLKRRS